MTTNTITQTNRLQALKPEEIAWLAGIYEGEGSCTVTSGRAIHVEICMTDEDIMQRIYSLTGIGTLTKAPIRNNYKQTYRWGIGSLEATQFLETILPWLGNRRSVRAKEAITNWKTNRRQSTVNDTTCVNGHPYDAPNNRRTKYGTCHLCNLESSKRYREKQRIS